MLDLISQILATVLGGVAIWLVSRKEHWKRWGYIVGLFSQPFWFITLVINKQYILIGLCCWYTYSWAQGIWNYWIKES